MSGFNLSERQIFFLNLLIGLLIIPFVGLCVSDLVRLRLTTSVLPTAAETPHHGAVANPTAHHPRVYYNTIVKRDIFNLPLPPQAPTPTVGNDNLPLRLVGTSQFSSGKPYAILENPMGVQTLYRVGDTIPNAGPLLDVQPDHVLILHDGHRVAVKMDNVTPTPAKPLAPPPGFQRRGMRFRPGREMRAPVAPGIHRMGQNQYRLDRKLVDSELNNMAPLFTQIRATPNMMNGQSSGFLLSEIQPNSVFQQIGLQDGDLLASVNGQSVGDPAKAMGLLQSLQTAPVITLGVIRNGAPVQLFYNIR